MSLLINLYISSSSSTSSRNRVILCTFNFMRSRTIQHAAVTTCQHNCRHLTRPLFPSEPQKHTCPGDAFKSTDKEFIKWLSVLLTSVSPLTHHHLCWLFHLHLSPVSRSHPDSLLTSAPPHPSVSITLPLSLPFSYQRNRWGLTQGGMMVGYEQSLT